MPTEQPQRSPHPEADDESRWSRTVTVDTTGTPRDLLEAAIDMAGRLDVTGVLEDFVASAAWLTGAQYAAIAVLDNRGETATFVQHGISQDVHARLGGPPRGHGVFSEIPHDGYLLLNDLTQHPSFEGFPPNHPPMHSFLGVPVRIKEQVFGRLYLAEKPGGFTEEDAEAMQQLATAAAVAVENSLLYAAARDRERWIAVSQEITTTLLGGADVEEALDLIATRVREVARADTALIVLPSVGSAYVCEIADGAQAREFIGLEFPADGRAVTAITTGSGMIVDSLARARAMRVPLLGEFGPALYAPMVSQGTGAGVIILLRAPRAQEFTAHELTMAESLAAQAALALEFATARHAQDLANLLDERQRISRDLHDLAVQQLFATGMQLETARKKAAASSNPEVAEVAGPLEDALSSVDESVRQIRSIVHSLRDSDEDVGLIERLRREASLARTGLGFAPSLVISSDELTIDESEGADQLASVAERAVDPDVADDVVAVVRECFANAARHARATSVQAHVRITTARTDQEHTAGTIVVEVVDDGSGVDRTSTRRSGVTNLAARARRHGGDFSLGPSPSGRGTRVLWEVPLG